MYKHCMLDLETLGTKPKSVVLSIGAVLFNPEDTDNYDTIMNNDDRIFHAVIEFQSQLDKGRLVTESTILWWMKQNKMAQSTAFSDSRTEVREALLNFSAFSKCAGIVWGNGSSFDNVILESLYDDYGLVFWPNDENKTAFYNYCDLRTARRMAKNIPSVKRGVEHDALQDAAYQVLMLQGYWK